MTIYIAHLFYLLEFTIQYKTETWIKKIFYNSKDINFFLNPGLNSKLTKIPNWFYVDIAHLLLNQAFDVTVPKREQCYCSYHKSSQLRNILNQFFLLIVSRTL